MSTSASGDLVVLRPLLSLLLVLLAVPHALRAQRVEVALDPALGAAPRTGRVFVFFTRDTTREPRLQAGSYGGSVPFFGVDVSAWRPGTPAVIDASVLGYPYESLAQVPPGDYVAQALLNVYTEFRRADGHTIWAHADQWEGQRFNVSPGNLVSA
ncbi:MAG: hypothetical protein MUE41_12395, partial [Gemmatimonadaceae bacterium]|nr:hypothetical protein [Gemmatimonadaceae bacterium]